MGSRPVGTAAPSFKNTAVPEAKPATPHKTSQPTAITPTAMAEAPAGGAGLEELWGQISFLRDPTNHVAKRRSFQSPLIQSSSVVVGIPAL